MTGWNQLENLEAIIESLWFVPCWLIYPRLYGVKKERTNQASLQTLWFSLLIIFQMMMNKKVELSPWKT